MKKYTMDDFIHGKIIVRVDTEKEAETFLKMCEKRGLKWKQGCSAMAFCPLQKSFYFTFEAGCIAYGFPSFISGCLSDRMELAYVSQIKEDYSILELDPFKTGFPFGKLPKQPHRYRITIECNGDMTTAQMEIDGTQIKTATAKRNPADKFSWRIGAKTAFDRLFEKKPKKVLKRFKIGDAVKIIKGPYKGTHGNLVKMNNDGKFKMISYFLIIYDHFSGKYRYEQSPKGINIIVDISDVAKI